MLVNPFIDIIYIVTGNKAVRYFRSTAKQASYARSIELDPDSDTLGSITRLPRALSGNVSCSRGADAEDALDARRIIRETRGRSR